MYMYICIYIYICVCVCVHLGFTLSIYLLVHVYIQEEGRDKQKVRKSACSLLRVVFAARARCACVDIFLLRVASVRCARAGPRGKKKNRASKDPAPEKKKTGAFSVLPWVATKSKNDDSYQDHDLQGPHPCDCRHSLDVEMMRKSENDGGFEDQDSRAGHCGAPFVAARLCGAPSSFLFGGL